MLYSNSTAAFNKLTDVLRKLSVPEETLSVMCDYLDVSKPRDNSLLAGIDTVRLPADISWQLRDEIDKAVSREIVKGHDDELSDRFVLFIFAVFKSACHYFIPEQMTKLRSGATVFSPKEHFETVAKTLTSLLGEDAKAGAYAVNVTYAFSHGGNYRMPVPVSPEVCRAAAKYLNDSCNTPTLSQRYYAGRAYMCLSVFETSDSKSEHTKWAADQVLELWDSRYELEGDALFYLMCATAEAAPYEHKAAVRFKKEWSGLVKGTVETATGFTEIPMKFFDYAESDESLVIPGYMAAVAFTGGRLPDKQARLERYAKEHPDRFREAISILGEQVVLARELGDILSKAAPGQAGAVDDLREKNRQRLAKSIREQFGGKQEAEDYVMGRITLAQARAALSNWCIGGGYGKGWNYYKAYGIDEYLARAFTIMSVSEFQYGRLYRVERATGFMIEGREAEGFGMLKSSGLTLAETIGVLALCIDDMYSAKEKAMNTAAGCIADCADELAQLEVSKLSATGRVLAVRAMGKAPDTYRQKLIACADDGSKAVRAELAAIVGNTDWREEVTAMLAAKKAARRELALDIIAAQGAEGYTQELTKAFDAEKSDKIKARIGALIGVASPEAEKVAEQSFEEQLDKLIKASKKSALGFLFNAPLSPVHKLDGTEAGEDYLRALVVSYAPMTRSKLADDLAAKLEPKELETYAAEIFGRWCDDGAQAKHKSVLYFCAVHGGIPMVRTFMHYIKEWAENMRGAIAAEATRAMALGGSSEALMNIDNMSRKFKNKQVRSAAAEALASAAEALGITTEELADRIVPDLGFDERLCRVFDFGPRQFSVYLTPSLGLEIYQGEKQLKNLPKPGASDDPEKSAAAAEEFKELKKSLKNVVTSQKARLEYVLMCDRKWTSESWEKLFVKNAVMHCFAVGLIWGVYEDGALKDTFRYLDDGSFTTADEDEYTLPENARIGLVHPLELTKEQLSAWKEQLSDYEITQPFDQLGRKVFLRDDKELAENSCARFEYAELNSLSLIGKMTKLGWYKGQAEDAGCFFYFYREDISSRSTAADGKVTVTGSGAMLVHSGAPIQAYDFEGEEVTLGKLVFFKAGKVPDYYDKKQEGWLKLSEVSPRYFSEIILQMTTVSALPGEE
ncbi:MAG: DUF4132 domain-containing protein [Ruminococcus sp.]|nr:DUF4132 domain-containing protein [Ruminococcus sp.]